MSLPAPSIIHALNGAGVPFLAFRWKDNAYDVLSPAWVRAAWEAWVAALPNELTQIVLLGGGRTERRPLWVAEVFDCDDHARAFAAFVVTSCALDCIRTGRTRAGTALGPFDYTAEPKVGNRREGPHCAIWFADYAPTIYFFEPADGNLITLTATERLSITEGEAA